MSANVSGETECRSFHERSFNLINGTCFWHWPRFHRQWNRRNGTGETELAKLTESAITVTWSESSRASLTWKLNPAIGLDARDTRKPFETDNHPRGNCQSPSARPITDERTWLRKKGTDLKNHFFRRRSDHMMNSKIYVVPRLWAHDVAENWDFSDLSRVRFGICPIVSWPANCGCSEPAMII